MFDNTGVNKSQLFDKVVKRSLHVPSFCLFERFCVQSQTFFVVPERSTGGGVSRRGPGAGLCAPPPGLHPRTFIGSRPPPEPKPVDLFRRLSSAVLRWNRSEAGARGTLPAVERDGAPAAPLDRRISRDVPAHLHPPRDRRRAAEAGQPGRRRKCLTGAFVQNQGTSPFPVIHAPLSVQQRHISDF